MIRGKVPALEEDRSSHQDIELLCKMVRSGEIARILDEIRITERK